MQSILDETVIVHSIIWRTNNWKHVICVIQNYNLGVWIRDHSCRVLKESYNSVVAHRDEIIKHSGVGYNIYISSNLCYYASIAVLEWTANYSLN